MSRLAIMQPYFFPYAAYFQLIQAVDLFVIYDNIKYTKSGWINRNRILVQGKESIISLPLKADSDSLHVRNRYVSENFKKDKLLNQIRSAYHNAPYFTQVFPMIESAVQFGDANLFEFLHNSIKSVCTYLRIETPIMLSSNIPIDHNLRGQEKVLAICQALQTKNYINAIGGTELYKKDQFASKYIELQFIKSSDFNYQQFNNDFVPWLSIIDVMMFNDVDEIRSYLSSDYQLT
jgi:hypothetical protein